MLRRRVVGSGWSSFLWTCCSRWGGVSGAIGQSPWEWSPVWEQLGKRMTAELEPDPAWVVDDTGFPKQGTHSVGVERQYSGTLGKTGNCQVAVSLSVATRTDHLPTDFALY